MNHFKTKNNCVVIVAENPQLHRSTISCSKEYTLQFPEGEVTLVYIKILPDLMEILSSKFVVEKIFSRLMSIQLLDVEELQGFLVSASKDQKTTQHFLCHLTMKDGETIFRFLIILCNLDGLSSTSEAVRNIIETYFPGSVQCRKTKRVSASVEYTEQKVYPVSKSESSGSSIESIEIDEDEAPELGQTNEHAFTENGTSGTNSDAKITICNTSNGAVRYNVSDSEGPSHVTHSVESNVGVQTKHDAKSKPHQKRKKKKQPLEVNTLEPSNSRNVQIVNADLPLLISGSDGDLEKNKARPKPTSFCGKLAKMVNKRKIKIACVVVGALVAPQLVHKFIQISNNSAYNGPLQNSIDQLVTSTRVLGSNITTSVPSTNGMKTRTTDVAKDGYYVLSFNRTFVSNKDKRE